MRTNFFILPQHTVALNLIKPVKVGCTTNKRYVKLCCVGENGSDVGGIRFDVTP